jgi:hypothetical protein
VPDAARIILGVQTVLAYQDRLAHLGVRIFDGIA